MQILILKSLWGMTEGATWADKLRLIKEAGYDGVEIDTPSSLTPAVAPAEWRAILDGEGLVYVAQIYGDDAATLIAEMERASAYAPIAINAQSGRDFMTAEQGVAFFQQVLAAEKDIECPVVHETHRRRLLFSPWSTAFYLSHFPQLRLNADLSHWCVVTESLLADFGEAVTAAAAATHHIHARVGHAQGPQVGDPTAPEWGAALTAHETWWEQMRASAEQRGLETLTITPEYGPPPYMPTIPHTQEPVANLWDICLKAANRLRENWQL